MSNGLPALYRVIQDLMENIESEQMQIKQLFDLMKRYEHLVQKMEFYYVEHALGYSGEPRTNFWRAMPTPDNRDRDIIGSIGRSRYNHRQWLYRLEARGDQGHVFVDSYEPTFEDAQKWLSANGWVFLGEQGERSIHFR